MNALAISIITLIAKYGPDVVEKIISICHKDNVTKDDWDSLFAEIKSMDYDAAIQNAEKKA